MCSEKDELYFEEKYNDESDNAYGIERRTARKSVIGYTLKILILLGVTILMFIIAVFSVLFIVNYGPSENAHKLFVKSVKETSAIGFLADWFTTKEELEQILTENTIFEPDQETDTNLIHINVGHSENDEPENESTGVIPDEDFGTDFNGNDKSDEQDESIEPDEPDGTGVEPGNNESDYENSSSTNVEDGIGYKSKDIVSSEDGIIICKVSGTTYTGHMMIVEDPSRVMVGVCDGLGNAEVRGQKLATIMEKYGAVAGINAGGFEDENGKGTGSIPLGCAFSEGKLLYDGGGSSLVIGFDNNHILHVENMDAETAKAKGIRDAVTFKPALIVNGQPSVISGTGSGLNPRTAIGQRSDGAVLLLVVDGRQANSLGASYADLIKVMQNFGAVNAANLDGGSSSLMLYKGSSVSNPANLINNRYLPTTFIVK